MDVYILSFFRCLDAVVSTRFLLMLQDKAYLVKSLLHDGTPVKPQKVKRKPGSSGRLHKTDDGEWVWSDDEMTEDTMNETTVKSDSSGDDKTPPGAPGNTSATEVGDTCM